MVRCMPVGAGVEHSCACYSARCVLAKPLVQTRPNAAIPALLDAAVCGRAEDNMGKGWENQGFARTFAGVGARMPGVPLGAPGSNGCLRDCGHAMTLGGMAHPACDGV